MGATSTLIAPLRSVAKLAMGTHTEAKYFVRVALAAREFLISITKPSLEERRKELQAVLATEGGMDAVVRKPGDPLPSLLAVIEATSANADERAVCLKAMEGYLRRVYFSYNILSLAPVPGFEGPASITAIAMTYKVESDALKTNIGLGGMGGRATSFNDLASMGASASDAAAPVAAADATDASFLSDSLERTAVMLFAPSVEVLREELPKALTAAALSTTGKVKNVVHIVLPSAALNGQAPSGAASPSRRRTTSEEVQADDAAISLELKAFLQENKAALTATFVRRVTVCLTRSAEQVDLLRASRGLNVSANESSTESSRYTFRHVLGEFIIFDVFFPPADICVQTCCSQFDALPSSI